MKKKHLFTSLMLAAFVGLPMTARAQSSDTSEGAWTLQACIDYALAHNVQLLKNRQTEQSNAVDLVEAKAGRLPSLSASMTQNLSYRPFQETASSFVNGGIATSAADKTTQSGSYGVNASWTVWNGGITRMNIQNAQFNQQSAQYDTQEQENKIKEQIAQYYVQILYMTEAEKVNRRLLAMDSAICARGEEMVAVGSMAKADLAQLQSQVSSGRYDLVNIRTQIDQAKLQLRQLLELPAGTPFELASTDRAESDVLRAIPALDDVYAQALESRPEIKRAQLSIEQSQLNTKIAKAGYMPTISLTGGLGDSHMTGSNTAWGKQMKNNFNGALGLSVSIPIFDNRKNKSAVERAKISETTAQLDLQDAEKTLRQTIETYWLNATNSQAKYVAAKASAESQQTSYGLMSEQFNVGLKNIAELLNSRASLLNAEQTMLEDKYTALLNRDLLQFYAGE